MIRDDEFIVLLLQTDFDTSMAVVKRIAEAVQRESAIVGPSFTVTIGSATAPRDAQTIDELITIAGTRVIERMKPEPGPSSSTSVH